MLNFCTLFDSRYLIRGLAMYESLKRYCSDFHLYIFAFDDKSAKILKDLNLDNVTIITLLEFEDKKLQSIKSTRTKGEYCWTCTPSVILYVLEKFKVENCTYLDADIYFFSDPKVLLEELGNKSVLITEHRYTKKYDQTETSGKYCVQFVGFRNDQKGLEVLNWWRNACIDWCYARFEDGKFGDQKYLDDWMIKFNFIHELQNLGGGVAPWNVQQYKFNKNNNILKGEELSSKREFELVFYHFHSLKFVNNILCKIVDDKYELSDEVEHLIYNPYLVDVKLIAKKLSKKFSENFIYSELKMDFFKKMKIFFFGKKNYIKI